MESDIAENSAKLLCVCVCVCSKFRVENWGRIESALTQNVVFPAFFDPAMLMNIFKKLCQFFSIYGTISKDKLVWVVEASIVNRSWVTNVRQRKTENLPVTLQHLWNVPTFTVLFCLIRKNIWLPEEFSVLRIKWPRIRPNLHFSESRNKFRAIRLWCTRKLSVTLYWKRERQMVWASLMHPCSISAHIHT